MLFNILFSINLSHDNGLEDDEIRTRFKERCVLLDGFLSFLYTDKGMKSQIDYNTQCNRIKEIEKKVSDIENLISLYSIFLNLLRCINEKSLKTMSDTV